MTIKKLCERFGRTLWTTVSKRLSFDYGLETIKDYRQCKKEDAILISSLCEDGQHAPVLDIDFPAELIPSSSPGHFHLYLHRKMTWEKYVKLLDALHEAGIIDYEYHRMSIKRKSTMVLLPGIDRRKATEELPKPENVMYFLHY